MDKDKALDLALEALELTWDSGMPHPNIMQVGKAIAAIKQARALDKKAENARELGLDYEPDYKVTVVDDQHPNGVPLEQWGRPAPVQEPLEYWNAVEGWVKIDEVREHFNSVGCGTIYKTAGDGRVPLTAAQRTWVDLTDAERNKLWRDVIKWGDPSHDDVDLMKAIEAKLKEKNT